jgi:hypothetical protein
MKPVKISRNKDWDGGYEVRFTIRKRGFFSPTGGLSGSGAQSDSYSMGTTDSFGEIKMRKVLK